MAKSTEISGKSKHDYKSAIETAQFVSAVGWVSVMAGVGFSFWIFEEMGNTAYAILPVSLAASLLGLLLVISGQAARAVMDTANYSKQALVLLKNNALQNRTTSGE